MAKPGATKAYNATCNDVSWVSGRSNILECLF